MNYDIMIVRAQMRCDKILETWMVKNGLLHSKERRRLDENSGRRPGPDERIDGGQPRNIKPGSGNANMEA